MAKKKGRVQSRKGKKKKISPVLSSIKKLFLWAFAVVACLIGLLFLYDLVYPLSKSGSVERVREHNTEAVSAPAKRSAEKLSKKSTTYAFPEKVEIPKLNNKRKEQVIKHEGYTVSYNSDYRIANWVAYELTAKEAKSKKAERSNKFVPDPLAKGASALNGDYTRSGYDRGHLAPAGDMKWSAKAMRESFYFSNICPQVPGLNRGVWKELEEQARLWAIENGSLLIVTGPVITDDMKRLGKNRVGIPQAFYKVICTVVDGTPQGIAFLFDNKDYDKVSLGSKAIPIDRVEGVTGIDFFPALPDDVEQKMESVVNPDKWSF